MYYKNICDHVSHPLKNNEMEDVEKGPETARMSGDSPRRSLYARRFRHPIFQHINNHRERMIAATTHSAKAGLSTLQRQRHNVTTQPCSQVRRKGSRRQWPTDAHANPQWLNVVHCTSQLGREEKVIARAENTVGRGKLPKTSSNPAHKPQVCTVGSLNMSWAQNTNSHLCFKGTVSTWEPTGISTKKGGRDRLSVPEG